MSRARNLVLSGSGDDADPLRYVRAATEKIAACAAREETVMWYVDRDGLRERAVSRRRNADLFVARTEDYFRDLLALVRDASSLRIGWLGSRRGFITDINRQPPRSVRSLSIYAQSRDDVLLVRDRPGLLTAIELQADTFALVSPMIFAPDAVISLHGAKLTRRLAQRVTKILDVSVNIEPSP